MRRRRRKPRASRPAARRGRVGRLLRRIVLVVVAGVAAFLLLCTGGLLACRWIDPPSTALQVERRVESWVRHRPYHKAYRPVPLGRIPDHLEHAVIAAEDTRFLQHAGIDWSAVQEAAEDNRRRGQLWRGGSTITQQLVKNLFLTTKGAFVRKALEVPLAYAADWILPKPRILELYLNVIEWGDGVYGAEAAALHHYGRPARELSRAEAAALAACIPDPRRRRPQRMDRYRDVILARMTVLGW